MPSSWKNNSLHLTEESRFTVEGAWVEDNLLVSSPGSDSQMGGLYYVKRSGWMGGSEVWCLDRLASRGIDATDELLVRSIQNDDHMVLTIYGTNYTKTVISERGINIHDVRIIDGAIYAVSTGSNEILSLSTDGTIVQTWTLPGGNDSWHINGIDRWDGKLVACAFGKFEGEGAYEGKTKDAGVIFDLESTKDVWPSLTGPHSPRCDANGIKYVCDSGNRRLLIKSTNGEKVIDFKNAFPRGLAIGDSTIYIGLNYVDASNASSTRTCKIAMLDKVTFEHTGELVIDIPEIYDIVCVRD